MTVDEFEAMVGRPAVEGTTAGRIPTLDDYTAALAALRRQKERAPMKTIELKKGDACPACGGELKPVRVPTADQFAKAADKENPVALPTHADTATPEQRAELGELHRCGDCGYATRFPPAAGKGAKAKSKDDE